MKKILYLSFVIVLGLNLSSAYAQNAAYDRGSTIVIGSFAYSSAGGELFVAEPDEDGRITTLQINPSLSYFVAPGLAIGGKVLFQRTAQDDDSFTTWGLGPQILYFIGSNRAQSSVKGTTYPYLGATFAFLRSTAKSTFRGQTDKDSANGTVVAFGLGINHMLTDSASLFVEGAYELDHMSGEGDSASGNKFNIVAGVAIFLY